MSRRPQHPRTPRCGDIGGQLQHGRLAADRIPANNQYRLVTALSEDERRDQIALDFPADQHGNPNPLFDRTPRSANAAAEQKYNLFAP
ncbi:hypothetical protein AB0M22_31025 [Nocardia sp. NPDC051756]|uniref:hypothetical protein n=1 Tax=Nocardia sp. NPDC051756 TaxID=3154751 RepID=UPI003432F2E7